MNTPRAIDANLARCESCAQLCKLTDGDRGQCPRCGSAVSLRYRHSLQRTLALCLASIFLLIPANTLPIMTVNNLGNGQPDTIMSGVIRLWQADLAAIAAIVFIASILVPILKLLALILLMCVVKMRLRLSSDQCTRLYRFVHLIGRWSMLDLFMISILVSVVGLGNIASVDAGPGATAFAAVVILTMLAANCFDPRLIWDLEEND
ncbi:paraquat-inducible membrane protein A [Spongiibacter sp. KMU-166]|uniref:Paraquat-inducible membrane protein A n=1 Tax=Spongiibacter thalassae TaxID=2721624 RepID=A0ABX1GAT1_9GAMM|nr:paraquat-inducible protein A [Spongiibacter thalassae]NKI16273.1 paraquat-inducible membrane protein A [Spongiibacter thalassae]